MGLQEHDLIMAAKKVSGKTVKKVHLLALVGQNGSDR